MLSPLQGKARALCDVFGGSKKTVRDMNIDAVLSAYHSANIHGYKGKLPVKGLPGQAAEARQDRFQGLQAEALHHSGPTEMRSARAPGDRGPPNKPGKVNFMLYRHDGAKQAASLKTGKTGNGYAKRCAKTYTFEKSTKRKYVVVLKGHPLSTNWVPLNVNCGLEGAAKVVNLKK